MKVTKLALLARSSAFRRFPVLLTLISLALPLGLPLSAQAQTIKIGVIDLKKVFDGYYKTKQADSQLKERAGDNEKVLKGMIDDYQKFNEDYKKLVDTANDQAVSGDEREKRKKIAEAKLTEIQDLEKNVTTFRRQVQTTLDDTKRRLRDNILREIREVVNTKAKSGNYSMIVDISGESINMTPIILFNSGQNDLTEEVLAQVNASAPPGSLEDKPAAPTSVLDDKKK